MQKLYHRVVDIRKVTLKVHDTTESTLKETQRSVGARYLFGTVDKVGTACLACCRSGEKVSRDLFLRATLGTKQEAIDDT